MKPQIRIQKTPDGGVAAQLVARTPKGIKAIGVCMNPGDVGKVKQIMRKWAAKQNIQLASMMGVGPEILGSVMGSVPTRVEDVLHPTFLRQVRDCAKRSADRKLLKPTFAAPKTPVRKPDKRGLFAKLFSRDKDEVMQPTFKAPAKRHRDAPMPLTRKDPDALMTPAILRRRLIQRAQEGAHPKSKLTIGPVTVRPSSSSGDEPVGVAPWLGRTAEILGDQDADNTIESWWSEAKVDEIANDQIRRRLVAELARRCPKAVKAAVGQALKNETDRTLGRAQPGPAVRFPGQESDFFIGDDLGFGDDTFVDDVRHSAELDRYHRDTGDDGLTVKMQDMVFGDDNGDLLAGAEIMQPRELDPLGREYFDHLLQGPKGLTLQDFSRDEEAEMGRALGIRPRRGRGRVSDRQVARAARRLHELLHKQQAGSISGDEMIELGFLKKLWRGTKKVAKGAVKYGVKKPVGFGLKWGVKKPLGLTARVVAPVVRPAAMPLVSALARRPSRGVASALVRRGGPRRLSMATAAAKMMRKQPGVAAAAAKQMQTVRSAYNKAVAQKARYDAWKRGSKRPSRSEITNAKAWVRGIFLKHKVPTSGLSGMGFSLYDLNPLSWFRSKEVNKLHRSMRAADARAKKAKELAVLSKKATKKWAEVAKLEEAVAQDVQLITAFAKMKPTDLLSESSDDALMGQEAFVGFGLSARRASGAVRNLVGQMMQRLSVALAEINRLAPAQLPPLPQPEMVQHQRGGYINEPAYNPYADPGYYPPQPAYGPPQPYDVWAQPPSPYDYQETYGPAPAPMPYEYQDTYGPAPAPMPYDPYGQSPYEYQETAAPAAYDYGDPYGYGY